MKKLLYCLILTFLMTLFACENNDDISSPDPNLFLGTWQLVSSTIDNDNIVLDECSENSKLILYWFSEQDPVNNAQLYDYILDENEECVIIENINDASWAPALNIDASGNITPTVGLRFVSKEKDTVLLELDRKDELLTLSGQLSVGGESVSIRREYRKLLQQI
ncbi:hypothetical protein [Allomuricauda sp. SCSIO 65647]|uniref:hypothetical protein n=1 Tax=Allomuricauda sp. SCSIO 65647 TaxID=2908843 RepID=UPI001F1F3D5C|nr:hypothetical protein [Muricauda sp. SCSIO 65647]UJH67523.1 hypothetical protein L0P89_16435 [Muricauda sp. SCSIO 65647]